MALAALPLALLAAAPPAASPTPEVPKVARVAKVAKMRTFGNLRSHYLDSFWKRFPVVATYFGAEGLDPAYARLDGRLRDYTPAALAAERNEWQALKGELKRLDAASLSDADRIDAEVMSAQLAFLLRNLDRGMHEKAIDVYVEEPLRGCEWLLQGMRVAADGSRGTPSEWKALANRVSAVPGYLKTALANLRRGATAGSYPDRRMIVTGAAGAAATADYFDKTLPQRVKSELAAGEAQARLLSASAAAARAFRELRQGLMALYFQPGGAALRREFDRDRFALGEEGYAWALRNNLRVARTPRELFAYGKARVAETLSQMTSLAQSIAQARGWPDASLAAVASRLSDETPRSDAEMLEWYQAACRRLVEYGRKTGMFDPPEDYRLDVVFTPPPLRATLDAAYYPAPVFKKSGVGQFYVTPTGDDPAALRAHARAAVASLAAHEGFPGHDWYYRVLSGGPAISPVRWITPGGVEESASMWEDSMSSEGWALYVEQLVGEPRPGHPDGFYTAEERLFQLQNQLLRDARIVVDVGIHCGLVSFDDAVAYFARNVYLVKGPVTTDEAGNPSAAERAMVEQARRDIFRYSKWPTQAITYHLGKAAIVELREKARAIEGAGFDERRFHAELLSFGSIPQAYFEASLLAASRARAEQAAAAPAAVAATPVP